MCNLQEDIKRAIEACDTAQTMIDINAQHLDGLRTTCATNVGLTQNEIRRLETKLLKLFTRQLIAKCRVRNFQNVKELQQYPKLRLWLKVVGVSETSCDQVCKHIGTTLESVLGKEESALAQATSGILAPEEQRRLLKATSNLRAYTELQLKRTPSVAEVDLSQHDANEEMPLHWDSWQRNTPPITPPSPAVAAASATTPLVTSPMMSSPTSVAATTLSLSAASTASCVPCITTNSASSSSLATTTVSPPPPPLSSSSFHHHPHHHHHQHHHHHHRSASTTAAQHNGTSHNGSSNTVSSGSSGYYTGSANSSPARRATSTRYPSATPPSSRRYKLSEHNPPLVATTHTVTGEPHPLTKSRSHEENLERRVENLDMSPSKENHQGRRRRLATEPGLPSPPSGAAPTTFNDQTDGCFADDLIASQHSTTSQSSAISSQGGGGPPRSPRLTGGMSHSISHRFTTTVKVTICQQCEKPMFFGYKCRDCKFRCHRDCMDKVPAKSCGLPNAFVNAFKERLEEASPDGVLALQLQAAGVGGRSLSPMTVRRANNNNNQLLLQQQQQQLVGGSVVGVQHDSSSNSSSCNSSTPSSPFVVANSGGQKFRFPPEGAIDLSTVHTQESPMGSMFRPMLQASSPQQSLMLHNASSHTNNAQLSASSGSPSINGPTVSNGNASADELVETQKSNDSDKTVLSSHTSNSGSISTDSEKTLASVRIDSQDSQEMDANDSNTPWPRQNSLSLREWDIPFDEVQLEEKIAEGRFSLVYRGNWHGAVAVKMLNMDHADDDRNTIETFKQEVATFRKTRHENLVLFMGACMKPPQLAIVTSLCRGSTLYRLVHVLKEKFNINKICAVCWQICQGMGYLHARGIIHKDLRTKNIFYDNNKVVITDFGLFSVTKLCQGNRKGDFLTIPQGWLCYLAPELLRTLRASSGGVTDAFHEHFPFSTKSDIYAFGTVFYELMMGEWPFQGQPPEVIIWQVSKGIKPPLQRLQTSQDVKDVLMMCWSWTPEDRLAFAKLVPLFQRLPRKRLARSPSHPVQLSRSAESVF